MAPTVLLLATMGCAGSPSDVRAVLQAEGYQDIDVGGFRMGCGRDDGFANEFTATRDSLRVFGVVCTGLFKGSTVRITATTRIAPPPRDLALAAADSLIAARAAAERQRLADSIRGARRAKPTTGGAAQTSGALPPFVVRP